MVLTLKNHKHPACALKRGLSLEEMISKCRKQVAYDTLKIRANRMLTKNRQVYAK